MELLSLDAQERLVDLAWDAYQGLVESGRGRLLFIAGESGTGRTATLELIERDLVNAEPEALVIRGSLKGGEFRTLSHRPAQHREALATLAGLVSLAAVPMPFLALVAAVLLAISGIEQVREEAQKGDLASVRETDLPALLLRRLRREAARRPVVLLLDDVDQASGVWVTGFLSSLALELPVNMRALVGITLVGGEQPSADDPSQLMRIARHEVTEREVADWCSLPHALTAEEVRAWLGPMTPRLLRDLMVVTGGNLALVAGVWRVWRQERLVTRTGPDAAWRLVTGREDSVVEWLPDATLRRLDMAFGGDASARDRAWDALKLGALEGLTFTAEGVAGALFRPLQPTKLIEELDGHIVASEEGDWAWLVNAGLVPLPRSRALRRYKFATDLLWRRFRSYVAPDEFQKLCGRLANALASAYAGHEGAAARVIGRLYTEAGEHALAAPYHVKADFQGSLNALMAQGAVLMTMPTEDWDGWHYLDAARRLDKLGSMLHAQGELEGAQPLLERALAIREDWLRPDHLDRAASLNNLASLFQDQGRLREAHSLYKRALGIRERTLGPDDPQTAVTLSDLAGLLQAQGNFDQARPLYERALKVFSLKLGPEHPYTATTRSNLAFLLKVQGHLDQARSLYEQALDIRERRLGPDHPDTASTIDNLASLLQAQGQLDMAQELYGRALDIRERKLGPDHPATAANLNNLASVLHANGHVGEARSLYERALDINERKLGPDHPTTAISLGNLAGVLQSDRHFDQARPLRERALDIIERKLGPDHPLTASSLNNQAGLLWDEGCLDQARPLYERALAINERVLGPDHPTTASSIGNLAGLLQAQGQTYEALSLYERALDINERKLGSDHPDTARGLANLGGLFQAEGEFDRARPLYERALDINVRKLGPDHPKTVATRELLDNLDGGTPPGGAPAG